MKYNFIHINKCDVEIDFSVESTLKSFKEEVLDHFEQICKNKDVKLILSGGGDSRFIARCLIELGIPFTACTYVHKKDLSDYDSLVSTSFCRQWKIKHEPIYLDERLFSEFVMHRSQTNRVVHRVFNLYMMEYMMKLQQDKGFQGIFLSGACSEYKVINGKMPITWQCRELIRNNSEKWFNFTTDRILLSYVRHPIFLKEFKTTKEKGFDIRDKIYKDCFPDTVFPKKNRGSHFHIEDWFNKKLPIITAANPMLCVTDLFEWDFEKYLIEKKLI